MLTYDVTVTREGPLWVASIAGNEIGPASTDTERFEDLETEVRDIIALLTDSDEDDFDLRWKYETAVPDDSKP